MNEMKMRGRGYRRIAALGSGGAAVAVTMLMLLAPLSAAATTVIPIKSLGASVSYSVSTGACAKAKQMIAPTWSPSTGMFRTAGSATAPKCAPSPSVNAASWNAQIGLAKVLHFKTAGNHVITAAWTVTMVSSWAANPYSSCALNYVVAFSACITSADAEVFGFAYLYDQNNGSYFNFGTYVTHTNYTTVENYSQNYCYAGTCTHYGGNFTFGGGSGGFSGTFSQNSTINASGTMAVNNVDSYQLYIVLFVFVNAEAYAQNAKPTGVATASASVNMGTLGNGAHLTKVSYT